MSLSKTFAHRVVMFFTLIIGYEFLMSGLSKLFGGFVPGFHHELGTSINAAFGFYHPVLQSIVLPNSTLFGTIIMCSELFAGVSFILIPLLGFRSFPSGLSKWGMVASILAVFLSTNVFFFSGDPFFVNPSDPYQEAVSIDLLLALMELTLFSYFYQANRTIKEGAKEDPQKVENV